MEIPDDIQATVRALINASGCIESMYLHAVEELLGNAILAERQRCAILVQLHPVATSFKAREEIAAAILNPPKEEDA